MFTKDGDSGGGLLRGTGGHLFYMRYGLYDLITMNWAGSFAFLILTVIVLFSVLYVLFLSFFPLIYMIGTLSPGGRLG